jgi:hypothetical protein
MAEYVVCQKKRNSPRLSIQICMEKCPDKDACDQYQARLKKDIVQPEPSLFQESRRNTAQSTV